MDSNLSDPAFWSRFQFGFTLTYHYLFPQLTMGLAWFLVYWKWRALSTGDEKYNQAVRFWARIFGLNFAVGVVTGVPMEFQFGTNWAGFSRFAGGVIGQTLAMEGMFAFFLESAFVGALIWGESDWVRAYHFMAAVAVATGKLAVRLFHSGHECLHAASGGSSIEADGSLGIASFSDYLLNPWAWIQFSHNQMAALVTGSFVVASIGALYTLRGFHPDPGSTLSARRNVRWADRLAAGRLSDRRPAGQDGRQSPAGHAGCHGRPIRGRDHGRCRSDRPTQSQGPAARQPHRGSRRSQLSRLRTFRSYVHGLERVP